MDASVDPYRTTEREIVLDRTYAAPRARVYAAWTSPAAIARWWGPDGFTTTTRVMDVRPGGVWDFTMHGPDGTDYPNRIQYREVVPDQRLAYTHGSRADDPDAFEVTVTFEERAGGTLVTLRSVFRTVERLRQVVEEFNAVEGGRQTLARLAATLAAGD